MANYIPPDQGPSLTPGELPKDPLPPTPPGNQKVTNVAQPKSPEEALPPQEELQQLDDKTFEQAKQLHKRHVDQHTPKELKGKEAMSTQKRRFKKAALKANSVARIFGKGKTQRAELKAAIAEDKAIRQQAKQAPIDQRSIQLALNAARVEGRDELTPEELDQCIVFKGADGELKVAIPVKESTCFQGQSWDPNAQGNKGLRSIDFANCVEFKGADGQSIRLQYTFDGTSHKRDETRYQEVKAKHQKAVSDLCTGLHKNPPTSAQEALSFVGEEQLASTKTDGLFNSLITVDNTTFGMRGDSKVDCASFTLSLSEEAVSCEPILTEHSDSKVQDVPESETVSLSVVVSDGIVDPLKLSVLRQEAQKLITSNVLTDDDWKAIAPSEMQALEDSTRDRIAAEMASPIQSIMYCLIDFSSDDQKALMKAFGIPEGSEILDTENRADFQKALLAANPPLIEKKGETLQLTAKGKEVLAKIAEEVKKYPEAETRGYRCIKAAAQGHQAFISSGFGTRLLPELMKKAYQEEIPKAVKQQLPSEVVVKEATVVRYLQVALPSLDKTNPSPEELRAVILAEAARKPKVQELNSKLINLAKAKQKAQSAGINVPRTIEDTRSRLAKLEGDSDEKTHLQAIVTAADSVMSFWQENKSLMTSPDADISQTGAVNGNRTHYLTNDDKNDPKQLLNTLLNADSVKLHVNPKSQDIGAYCIKHRLGTQLTEALPKEGPKREQVIQDLKSGSIGGREWVQNTLEAQATEGWEAYGKYMPEIQKLPQALQDGYSKHDEDDLGISIGTRAASLPPSQAK